MGGGAIVLCRRYSGAVLVCASFRALALMCRRVACLWWLCISVLRGCEPINVRAVAFELDPVSFRSTRTVSRTGEFASMPPRVLPCYCSGGSKQCTLAGEFRVTENKWTVLLVPLGNEVSLSYNIMILSARAQCVATTSSA